METKCYAWGNYLRRRQEENATKKFQAENDDEAASPLVSIEEFPVSMYNDQGKNRLVGAGQYFGV